MKARSVHLTEALLAAHRGSAPVALADLGYGLGRIFSLRSEAPATRLVQGDGEDYEVEKPEAELTGAGDAVAVLCIDGPLVQREEETFCGYIQGYDGIAKRFEAANLDPQVGALVLRIDSPGGDVAGLEECVKRCNAATAKSGKPVLSLVDEMAASAAYRLASGLSTGGIYLPPSGMVGSIGCLAAMVSEAKALEMAGVEVEVVRDPPGKAAGHPAEPISDLARERTQELVRAASAVFIAATAKARGLSVADIRALNGGMLTGLAAVEARLADGVASFEEVIARASAAASARKPARPAGLAGKTFAALGRVAPSRRGASNMSQALSALVGLPLAATDAELETRIRGLVAFETEAVAIAGESDPNRAIGALRAHVATSKRAGEIEAKANAERLNAVLNRALAGDPARGIGAKAVPAQIEGLRAFAAGPGGIDKLEAFLDASPVIVPVKQAEPKVENPETRTESGPVGPEPEKHEGKTYAQMSSAERSKLFSKDINKAKRMRAASEG